MKVRIKFQKYGAVKFIGHLDVMRYFQKAFRRAGIDNEYSKGFNPHQIMSFAAPLGVGLTSDGEYMDLELLSSDAPEVMIGRMNAALTEGFRITGFNILKDREENQRAVNAMALVASADYMVSLKDGYTVADKINTQEKFMKEFMNFYSLNEIIVDKKTKTSEKAVDLKPLITLAAFSGEEYDEKLKSLLKEESSEDFINPKAGTVDINGNEMDNLTAGLKKAESMADTYENGIRVYLQLATGSAVNIKPELVMEAFCKYLDIRFEEFAWQMHRLEVYTREDGGKLIPLDRLER